MLARKDKQNGLQQYSEYSKDTTKTNRGGLKHKMITPKVVRAYLNTSDPDQCIENVFHKYTRGPDERINNLAFYLCPLDSNIHVVIYLCQSEITISHLVFT